MQNFITTIINGVQKWTKKEIKKSTADWKQNDSSAVDYVKNRTHWEEKEKTTLVDNLTFSDYDSENAPKCNFVPGQKYDVIWNGVLYEGLVCWFDGEYNIIASSDNGCPFYIDDDGGDDLYISSDDDDDNWVVSIIEDAVVIHKLDSKYLDLPTNLATTDDVQEAVDVANEVQNTAKTALANAATAQAAADRKMDAANPVGTGSFSMNRIANSTVGSNSFTLGKNNKAQGQYSGALGEGIIANHNNVLVSGRYNKKDWSKYRGGYGAYSIVSFGYSFTDWKYNDSLNAFELIGASSSKTSYGDAEIGKKYAFEISTSTEGIIYTNEFAHILSKTYETYSGGKKSVRLSAYIYTSETGYRSAYANIVGNGTSDTERSNAHTLDWNGVGWFQGGLQVGGNGQDDGAKNVLVEGDAIPVPVSATIGQTVVVKAVDENGKPTEWMPADFPSGGGEEVWEEILNATITEDVGGCTFTEDVNGQPFRLKKASVLARIHGSNSATGGWINLDVSDGTNVLQVSQIPSGFAATEGQVNYRSFKTDVTLRETESFTMTFQSQNTSSAKDNLNNWNGVTSTFTSRKNPLKWISRFSFRCNGLAMGANTEIFIYGVRA